MEAWRWLALDRGLPPLPPLCPPRRDPAAPSQGPPVHAPWSRAATAAALASSKARQAPHKALLRSLPWTWWRRLAPLPCSGPLESTYSAVGALAQVERATFGAEFAPDGRLVVASCNDNCFRLFDGMTGELLGTRPKAHDDAVNVARFLNPHTFATVSDDASVRIWDLRRWDLPLTTLRGPERSWLKSCEYIAAQGVLLTTSLDNRLTAWHLPEFAAGSASAATHGTAAATPAYTGEGEHTGQLPDLDHSRMLYSIYLHKILFIRVSADQKTLVLTTTDGCVILVHNLDAMTLEEDLKHQGMPLLAPGRFEALHNIDRWTPIMVMPPRQRTWLRRNCVELIDLQATHNHRQAFITSPQFDPTCSRLYTRPLWAEGITQSMVYDVRKPPFIRRSLDSSDETDDEASNREELPTPPNVPLVLQTTASSQTSSQTSSQASALPGYGAETRFFSEGAVESDSGNDEHVEQLVDNVSAHQEAGLDSGDEEPEYDQEDIIPQLLRQWAPLDARLRGTIKEPMSDEFDRFFSIACFTECGRFICSPNRRGFSLYHVDPLFSNTDFQPRTIGDHILQVWLQEFDNVHQQRAYHSVKDLHQATVLGCAASPMLPMIASYGLDGGLRMSSLML